MRPEYVAILNILAQKSYAPDPKYFIGQLNLRGTINYAEFELIHSKYGNMERFQCLNKVLETKDDENAYDILIEIFKNNYPPARNFLIEEKARLQQVSHFFIWFKIFKYESITNLKIKDKILTKITWL